MSAQMEVGISEEIGFRMAGLVYARMAREWLLQEIVFQKDRLFFWFPVFLSIGIGIYFSLGAEPPFFIAVAGMAGALSVVILSAPEKRNVAWLLFLVALGFAAAQARTYLSYTPILQREIKATVVSGRIELIEDMQDGEGSRVLLSGVQIEKLRPSETPKKVRISVRKDEGLHVGQRMRVLAGIGPPSPPLAPGSFDFQRYMYFQQIGGLGFAFKAPEIIGQPDPRQDWIERTREAIDKKIAAVLPYPEAAIAMALTTGRRAAISDEANDAMTASGLAHILSISGLHIGLVSGIIFFVTRFLMVCVPGFGLRHPVKKYAAVLAFMGAVFYTLLAGAPIPAQRSLMMVGIALLAIVLDRSPLSMRLVAFAAFAVLLFAPESLGSASFQMSFAAVAGLIMVFDYFRPIFSALYANAGWLKRAALYVASVCLTTVIATVATAPLTLFHFQQFTLYGVIANVLAVPLSAFVVMPAAVAAFVGIPFGLEYWPLKIMGWGVTGMLDISVWVAALPYALIKLPALPVMALPCMAAGIIGIFLIKGRLKFIAAMPLLAAFVLIAGYRQPDVLISPGFDLAAVKDESGLYVSSMRKEKFIREKWESSYGLKEGSALVWPKEGKAGPLFCDEMACRAEIRGRRMSVLRMPGALGEECGWADVILAFDPLKGQKCGGKILIDKFDVLDNGAYAIRMNRDHIEIKAAEKQRGSRPWSSLNKRFSGRSASDLPAGPGF